MFTYHKILIRLGEITLKGKNRHLFLNRLVQNINNMLKTKVNVLYDRLLIDYQVNSLEELSKIFGITSYSPVIVLNHNLDDLKKMIEILVKTNLTETFKIQVSRNWKKFAYDSQNLNVMLGDFVLSKFPSLKVDLKNPKLKIEVEIREQNIYLFIKRIKGLGGLPVGINGKVLHLISGGIDSPVGAYEMMKRGIRVDFINFVSPPQTDDLTIIKVDKIIQHLNQYQGKSVVYRFDYSHLLNLLSLSPWPRYRISLMRRSFYRIASQIGLKNKYLGISTGENIGQVASQTLESLKVINNQSKLPVYRPLLTYDKVEIIDKAKILGTYWLSIEPARETCELFAPQRPIIKPKINFVEMIEKTMGDQLFALETNIINQKLETKIIEYK